MSSRIDRLRASLAEPLLVTDPANVRYLTGFESSNAALVVDPERARLFSDFRYAEAGRQIEGVEFTLTRRSLLADLADRLSGRLAFEADAVTYAGYETLAAGGIELVPCRSTVEKLRAVKDERELDAIGRASTITSAVYERLAGERFIGRTERDIAWTIEELFHELGGDGETFVLVAAGANGALPHWHGGGVEIEAGTTVVIDIGCTVDGYWSDCTRTFATGPLPGSLKEAYAVCLQAQQAGLEATRASAAGRDTDSAARSVIEEAGHGDAFGHGLGHGVGLLVHEAPRLAQESQDVLEPGNVVTVEPGIYLVGEGGIRIEDLVVVTDGGPEILTTFTKDLIDVS
jgi:Xaa-Pro aminopeptidase